MTSWVLGHIVMSIGTPLAILDGLAPSVRGKPLLRWWGIVLLGLLFALVALAVHSDGRNSYDLVPTAIQMASVSAVVVGLILIAFSPAGKPLKPRSPRWTPGWNFAFAVGLIGQAASGLGPWDWVGFAWMCAVILVVSTSVLWLAYSPDWGVPQITALACGALAAQTLMGFMAPAPEEMSPIFKYLLHAIFSLLVLCVCLKARTNSQFA